MSGFTRDVRRYGDRLVYEALLSKWGRHHGRCGCGRDWINAHAIPAGFDVIGEGSGFVVLTGPGLTEHVDEDALTTNALWEAVTGLPGTQSWYEPVDVVDRSDSAETERKAENSRAGTQRRARSQAAATALLTAPQLRYLASLVRSSDQDRFITEFNAAISGTSIDPPRLDELPVQAIERLTKSAARKLITALKTE